jgi:hypothetical protein
MGERSNQISPPRDYFQLDTLDIRPLPRMVLKHFTVQALGYLTPLKFLEQ